MEAYKHNNHWIHIKQDTDPINPREGEDLGTMVCGHRNYNLGDVQWRPEYAETLEEGVKEYLKTKSLNINDVIWLPLYLFDHSGITISTTPFNDRWDSMSVGFVFVEKKKIREEYTWGRITPKRTSLIKEYLNSEIELYDKYITGECYYFNVTEDEEGDDVIDSCCGFYSEKDCKEAAEESTPETV